MRDLFTADREPEATDTESHGIPTPGALQSLRPRPDVAVSPAIWPSALWNRPRQRSEVTFD